MFSCDNDTPPGAVANKEIELGAFANRGRGRESALTFPCFAPTHVGGYRGLKGPRWSRKFCLNQFLAVDASGLPFTPSILRSSSPASSPILPAYKRGPAQDTRGSAIQRTCRKGRKRGARRTQWRECQPPANRRPDRRSSSTPAGIHRAASTDEAVAGQRRSQKTRLTPASAARKFPGNEPAADAILLERRSVKTKVLFLEQAFWVNRQPTAAAGAGAVPAEAGKMSLGTITYRH